MARIHVLIDEVEREMFRAQARKEGRSLSDWLREAGRDRLRQRRLPQLATAADLDAFFEAIDQRHGDEPEEEDWVVHKKHIAAARTGRLPTDT